MLQLTVNKNIAVTIGTQVKTRIAILKLLPLPESDNNPNTNGAGKYPNILYEKFAIEFAEVFSY